MKKNNNTARRKLFYALEMLTIDQREKEASVVEFCRVAGISRNTFYAHYNNLGEVIEDYKKYKSAGLQEFASKKFFFKKHFIGRLSSFLDYLKDNFCGVNVYNRLNQSDLPFTQLMYEAIYNMMSPNIHLKSDIVIASFYIYGLIKIIDVWLTSGCKEPKEIILDNAKIAFDVISAGLLSKMN